MMICNLNLWETQMRNTRNRFYWKQWTLLVVGSLAIFIASRVSFERDPGKFLPRGATHASRE